DGRYWMYWGEGTCFAATSTDLVRWTPLEFDTLEDRTLERVGDRWKVHRVRGGPALRPVLFPRAGRFDSRLVEPGPPAVLTDDGIVLIYNGANHHARGDASLPAHAYSPGQALFDVDDPASCIARATEPFLRPDVSDHDGQVGDVCFAQGLVRFRGEWRLYLGLADSRIGVATAPS
ncbi:MAG: beta,2-mannosidase, partial [Actinomycetota bacterium]|nr:beta,2-mannosidase [Actinomycetota bacterium]